MSVVTLCRLVQSRWESFSQLVWPRNAEQLTQAEIARLTDELEGRHARLLQRRRRIECLRDRLSGLCREATSLNGEDAVIRAVQRNQDRLAEQEAIYDRQRRAFLRVKRLRQAMMRGQIVVCEERPDDD